MIENKKQKVNVNNNTDNSLGFRKMFKSNLARSAAILALMSAPLMESNAGIFDYFRGGVNRVQQAIGRHVRAEIQKNPDEALSLNLNQDDPGLSDYIKLHPMKTSFAVALSAFPVLQYTPSALSWLWSVGKKYLPPIGAKLLDELNGGGKALFATMGKYPVESLGILAGIPLLYTMYQYCPYLGITESSKLAIISETVDECQEDLSAIEEQSKALVKKLIDDNNIIVNNGKTVSKDKVVNTDKSQFEKTKKEIKKMQYKIASISEVCANIQSINAGTIIGAAKRKDPGKGEYADAIQILLNQVKNAENKILVLNQVLEGFSSLENEYSVFINYIQYGAEISKIKIDIHNKFLNYCKTYNEAIEAIMSLKRPLEQLKLLSNRLIKLPEPYNKKQ